MMQNLQPKIDINMEIEKDSITHSTERRSRACFQCSEKTFFSQIKFNTRCIKFSTQCEGETVCVIHCEQSLKKLFRFLHFWIGHVKHCSCWFDHIRLGAARRICFILCWELENTAFQFQIAKPR